MSKEKLVDEPTLGTAMVALRLIPKLLPLPPPPPPQPASNSVTNTIVPRVQRVFIFCSSVARNDDYDCPVSPPLAPQAGIKTVGHEDVEINERRAILRIDRGDCADVSFPQGC